MAYGEHAPSATQFLQDRVMEAAIAAVTPLLSSGNADLKRMAELVIASPAAVARDLTVVLRVNHAIDVTSTDAAIDTALGDSGTVLVLQRRLGIGVTAA